MSQMQGPNSPAWLCDLILSGIARLVLLGLPGRPANDTVQVVANLWIEAITSRPIAWEQERDASRVQAAFKQLAATADRWPAPKHFLDALPPHGQNPTLALPQPHNRKVPPHIREQIDAFVNRGKRIADGDTTH